MICGCCRRAYSPEEWRDLPLVGYQDAAAPEVFPLVVLELRNCSCGSTASRETDVAAVLSSQSAALRLLADVVNEMTAEIKTLKEALCCTK